MKGKYLVILIPFLFFVFASCNNNQEGAPTSSISNTQNESLLKPPPDYPQINGGLFWWHGGFNSYISTYKPIPNGGRGWNTIMINLENIGGLDKAQVEGYQTLIGIIDRDSILKNLQYALDLVDRAKTYNCKWVFIDDALTGGLVDASKQILKSSIDAIADRAHNLGMKVSVCEDYYTTFIQSGNRMDSNWSFFEKIDIIMPYGYNRSVSELNNFYYWIDRHYKFIVPMLGYNAYKGGPRYDQLGDRGSSSSSEMGYIELAYRFSYCRTVIYYFEDYDPENDRYHFTLSLVDELSNYLSGNNYFIGQPIPVLEP